MKDFGPRGHPTPWSEADERRLMGLVKEGYSASHIALQFNCKTSRVHDKLKALRGFKPKRRGGGRKSPGHKRKMTGAVERTCLKCSRTFLSEGIHNRMCTPCKASA